MLYLFETNEGWSSSIIKFSSNEECSKWISVKVKRWSCSFPHHDGMWGSKVLVPLFLYFGNRRRWVVTITLRLLYLRERTLITEDCALLGYYADSSGIFLPTFRDSLTVSSSGDMTPETREDGNDWRLNIGLIGCPETSVRNYHSSLCNNPEEHTSYLLRGGNLKSRNPDTHWIGRGVRDWNGLDILVKGMISCFWWGSNPKWIKVL